MSDTLPFNNTDDEAAEGVLPPEAVNIAEAVAGEMPTMPSPPDGVIRLPRGLLVEGKWESEVKVRELTGADEELLARRKSAVDYFDAVITLGVEQVGSVDLSQKPQSERERMLGTLLVGEREFLFLSVIRATFGNERDITYTCTSCQSELETTLLLDHDIVLVDDLGIDPPQTYEYTTSRGEVVVYRLANGADQKMALSKGGATQAEQNTTILTNVIRTVDGVVPLEKRDFVLGMSMKDRRAMVEELDRRQPSLDNELDIDCSLCGEPNKVVVDWGSLFRP